MYHIFLIHLSVNECLAFFCIVSHQRPLHLTKTQQKQEERGKTKRKVGRTLAKCYPEVCPYNTFVYLKNVTIYRLLHIFYIF